MHYLIDGYNLLFQAFETQANLKTNREALLFELQNISNFWDVEITVVFDGREKEISFQSFSHIQLVYTSKNLSADEYIVEILTYNLSPTLYTVVTSDKPLLKKCKKLGCSTMSIKKFLKFLEKKQTTSSTKNGQVFCDSPKNIDRLLTIFEARFLEKNKDD